MHNFRSNALEFQKLKSAYQRYLQTYRQLNGGSLAGAKDFFSFYYFINYTSRYSDPRSCVPLGYR